MKVYKCNVCGVEFYEGHENCPFCKEPASNATYMGEKGDRFDSADLYQEEVCETDTTRCEEDHVESAPSYDYSYETPKSYTPKVVQEVRSGNTGAYEREVINVSRPVMKTNRGVLYLILGIFSVWGGLILGLINIIMYTLAKKGDWDDSERRLAKIGVTISTVITVMQMMFVFMGIIGLVLFETF